MKRRAMTTGTIVAAVLLGLTSNVYADHRVYQATAVTTQSRPGPLYDYAPVISAEPIIHYVTVATPVRQCWQETEYYSVDRRPRGSGAKTLVGAIVGGVIGHQFGSGRGNDAATVAGTLIGAAVGNGSSYRHHETVQYSRPVERCKTTMQEHQEERIDGYHVVYRYNGQKYATKMPYDPGREMRVRVDVQPAG